MPTNLSQNGSVRVTPQQARQVLRRLTERKTNRLSPHQCGRAIEKKAFEWNAPLIGAGVGAAAGGLLSNRKKRGMGMLAGAGLGLAAGGAFQNMGNVTPPTPKPPTGLAANPTIPHASPGNYGHVPSVGEAATKTLDESNLSGAYGPQMNAVRWASSLPGLNRVSQAANKLPYVGKATSYMGLAGPVATRAGAAGTVIGMMNDSNQFGYKGEQSIYNKLDQNPKAMGNFGGPGKAQYAKDLGTVAGTGLMAKDREMELSNRQWRGPLGYFKATWNNAGNVIPNYVNLASSTGGLAKTTFDTAWARNGVLSQNDAKINQSFTALPHQQQHPPQYAGPKQLEVYRAAGGQATPTGGHVSHGGFMYKDPSTGKLYAPNDPTVLEYRRVILGQDI
jgi:hypothetical protein